MRLMIGSRLNPADRLSDSSWLVIWKGTDIESPRLAALRAALNSGNSNAIESFWSEVEASGTPLVEQHPERTDARIVTFLWKATDDKLVDSVDIVHFLRGYVLSENERFQRLGETNLWFLTDVMRSDVRTVYRLSLNGQLGQVKAENYEEHSKNWIADPLNKTNEQLFDPEPVKDPAIQSLLELPDAEPQPWFGAKDRTPTGTTHSHRFASEILDNERDVFVYTPPGYSIEAGPYPLLIHFDAQWRERPMQVPATLDNLIAAGAIPPTVAVFIDNVDRVAELPCNEKYAAAISTELVPWMRETYQSGLTPDRVIAAGQSYGGLASMWLSLQHPEVVGNVLSQSGSFWWGPDYVELEKSVILGDAPVYEWLTAQVAQRPTAPIRIWMEAGSLESAPNSRGYSPTLFVSNRHMHKMLIAKNYDVTFREYVGAHDFVTWRGSIAEGLIHLLGQ